MLCPKTRVCPRDDDHPVTAALRDTAADEVTVELIDPEQEPRWNKLVRQHHYLKQDRMVGESLRYVAKQNGKWIALLGWSSAAFHLDARDRYIGWTDLQRKARRHWVVCNARFALLSPKSATANLASRILSLNLKRLSDDWVERYRHPVVLAETFVDPERFEGTCYRAANWIQIGVTKGFGRSRLEFYQLHAKPKAIFLYPLHPQATELLSAPVLSPDWARQEHRDDPHRYPLSTAQTHSLLQALRALRDPRRYKGRLHRKVAAIVAIAIAAMVAGNNSLSAIGQFSKQLNQTQLRSLGASRCRKTGQWLAPSETTIRRVLQRLDPAHLDSLLNDWLASHLKDTSLSALAADGKCARTASKINGQSIQLFSALDVQSRIVRGQMQIPCKTNEIPALKDLLAQLDLRGTLVSLDALHTQKTTASFLVEQKQADYLFTVKDNQPKLFQKLARLSKTESGVFFSSTYHAGSGPRPA